MADKHEATYHGRVPCECGELHMSILEGIHCLEQIETEDRAARREPRPKKPSNIVRAID